MFLSFYTDLGWTVTDLVRNKGSKAAAILREKADQLEEALNETKSKYTVEMMPDWYHICFQKIFSQKKKISHNLDQMTKTKQKNPSLGSWVFLKQIPTQEFNWNFFLLLSQILAELIRRAFLIQLNFYYRDSQKCYKNHGKYAASWTKHICNYLLMSIQSKCDDVWTKFLVIFFFQSVINWN